MTSKCSPDPVEDRCSTRARPATGSEVDQKDGLRARFSSAITLLEGLVSDLDPDLLSGADATSLFADAVRLERLGGVARLILAKRIQSSGVFGDTGHRSAAELIAEHSGTDVGSARGTLELAQQLEACPATADALADGTLSALQAKEIVGGVLPGQVVFLRIQEHSPLAAGIGDNASAQFGSVRGAHHEGANRSGAIIDANSVSHGVKRKD